MVIFLCIYTMLWVFWRSLVLAGRVLLLCPWITSVNDNTSLFTVTSSCFAGLVKLRLYIAETG